MLSLWRRDLTGKKEQKLKKDNLNEEKNRKLQNLRSCATKCKFRLKSYKKLMKSLEKLSRSPRDLSFLKSTYLHANELIKIAEIDCRPSLVFIFNLFSANFAIFY